MGSFYTNITARGPEQADLARFLEEGSRVAWVSPVVDGMAVVYDERCEAQDVEMLARLSRELSSAFACATLAVLNHDSDVLMYLLHVSGDLIDHYNSSPSYFGSGDLGAGPRGGDAGALCAAFAAQSAVAKVRKILRSPSDSGAGGYLMADDRHRDLALALGIPLVSVGYGYHYLSREPPDPGIDWTAWRRTGT